MKSERTKEKIIENLDLLKKYLATKGFTVDADTETVLYNALDWTAEDVYEQLMGVDQNR